jgi:hypothetical protein
VRCTTYSRAQWPPALHLLSSPRRRQLSTSSSGINVIPNPRGPCPSCGLDGDAMVADVMGPASALVSAALTGVHVGAERCCLSKRETAGENVCERGTQGEYMVDLGMCL